MIASTASEQFVLYHRMANMNGNVSTCRSICRALWHMDAERSKLPCYGIISFNADVGFSNANMLPTHTYEFSSQIINTYAIPGRHNDEYVLGYVRESFFLKF